MTYHPSHSLTAMQVVPSFLRLLPWHRQRDWVVPVMIWSSSYFKKLPLFGPLFVSLDVRLHHLRWPTMMNWGRRVWTIGMSKWIEGDEGTSVRRLAMKYYYLSTIIGERQLYGRWSSVSVSHTPAYATSQIHWSLEKGISSFIFTVIHIIFIILIDTLAWSCIAWCALPISKFVSRMVLHDNYITQQMDLPNRPRWWKLPPFWKYWQTTPSW